MSPVSSPTTSADAPEPGRTLLRRRRPEEDPGHTATNPLDAGATPRPRFQVTRRIVGASRYPLGVLTAIYAVNQSHQFLVPVLFPFIKEEFQLSDTALGFLGGSYLFTLTVAMVPFGILADRVRRTKVIGWGTAAWGLAMLYAGLAGSYVHVFLARTFLGIADPADNPTSQSLLADYYPVIQRAKVMGVYEAGRLLGILALPIAGAMAEAWGWRSAFFFFALPGFVLAVMAWFLPEPVRGGQDRRHQMRDAPDRSSADDEVEEPSVYDRQSSWHAYKAVLRVPTFTISLVSSGVANFFLGGIAVWSVTYMIRYHDLGVSQASAAVGLFAIGALVGSLSAGSAADALASRGFGSSRIYVAGAARVLAFLLFIPTFLTSNTVLMLFLFTVAAAALVAPIPALHAVRADVLHPKLRGRGNALDAVTQSLAGAVSPILFGFVSDLLSLRAAFLTIVPVVGGAGLLLLVLGPRFYAIDTRRMLDEFASDRMRARSGGTSARDRSSGDPEPRRRDGVDSDDREPLLDVRDVEFSYGSLQVLFGVNFRLEQARCAALLGPNGVGKTTFLKVVSGHLEPQAGEILLDGEEITGIPPEQRAWLGVTLMAGGRSTFPSLTVRENLWMGAFPFVRRAPRLAESRMERVLDTFPPLRSRLSQTAGTLSGGEQQMVALGRALVAGSRLLLIDELSMGLAPVVTEELLAAAREIVALGTSLLIVEQSVDIALELADDVFAMEKGEIERLGSARTLRRKSPDEIPSLLLGPTPADGRGSAGSGRSRKPRRSRRSRSGTRTQQSKRGRSG